jgi:hypothetical protein
LIRKTSVCLSGDCKNIKERLGVRRSRDPLGLKPAAKSGDEVCWDGTAIMAWNGSLDISQVSGSGKRFECLKRHT